MDIQRKLEIFTQATDSIATHDDEDSTVLLAALSRCEQIIEAKKAQVQAKVQAEVQAALGA